jgi:hypothetical protein
VNTTLIVQLVLGASVAPQPAPLREKTVGEKTSVPKVNEALPSFLKVSVWDEVVLLTAIVPKLSDPGVTVMCGDAGS